MSLAVDEKRLVLNYLNSGEPIAAAAGCVLNHTTNEYTDIPMIALSDGKNTWTTEDIYNLESFVFLWFYYIRVIFASSLQIFRFLKNFLKFF